MSSVFTVGFLVMLTLLAKSLLLDNDARDPQPQYVKSNR